MNESILSSYSPAELMINGDEELIEDEEIYPEDEIDDEDDDEEQDEEEQDDEDEQEEREERTSITPPPPPPPSIPSERGGRRKGVPKRLQIVDDHRSQPSVIPKTPPATIITSFNVEQEQRLASVYHNGNFDENNNEEENTLEIVDDLLADLVGEIVRKIREERQQKFENKPKLFHNKHEEKFIVPTSTQSVSTTNKSSMLFNETNKTKATKSSRSPPSVSSSSSSSSKTISNSMGQPAKRPKLSNDSTLSLQHQQLLWQMTQQLLMPNPTNELDTSSLLKQQLLGVAPPAKRSPGRPPKHSIPPQAMRSSTNMTTSPISQTSNFAPRRRGRPPKYVTERPTNPTNDFDQLFAAIENSVGTNPHRTTLPTAFASMLGQPTTATRNGTPASMMKQSAGQTRQNMSNAADLGLNIPKKRGPGRPPKNQTLVNSHANNVNFPPTMVPSSPSSFDFNAALIMFQQHHQQQQQHPR